MRSIQVLAAFQRRGMQGVAAALWLLVATAGWAAAPEQSGGDYQFVPGDVVRITVFRSPELTTEARVAGDGTITFPLVGSVIVGGMTATELEREIARQLRSGNFVAKPQVTVLPTQIFGNLVSVLGQVNRPGRYPIEGRDMRLTDMLAAAGGIAPTGGDEVTVSGVRAGKAFSKTVDIYNIFQSNQPEEDLVLAGGDTLYVRRAGSFYIYGNVQNPGVHRLERRMTLRQAIAAGGGATATGNAQNPVVHRRGPGGEVGEVSAKLADSIQDGDVIYIRERVF